jgi:hypothetical protein
MSRHRTTAVLLLALLAGGAFSATAGAAVPRIIFPVVAKVQYTDDFGAPRWQGSHQGNDIMAAWRSPVVAVEAGTVKKWTSSWAAGCMLYLHGRSGTTYMYVHLNNDLTRKNDNQGGCRNKIAYAPGLVSGRKVQAGQLLGYVGNSGDAEGGAWHLHFELHPNGGGAVSPYRKLRAAFRHLYARPRPRVTSIHLRVFGRVAATQPDVDPGLLRINVTRVRLSNGWWARPARRVTLAVPATTTVLRRDVAGANVAARFADAQVGERVVVLTHPFPQKLWWARGPVGKIQAQEIVLQGE